MQLIQELLKLTEKVVDKDTPIELKDLVANFPSMHGKAISKLWGGKRLTYKGQPFFNGRETATVYDGAIKAAEKAMKNLEVVLTVFHSNGKSIVDQEYTFTGVDESQECYLGYDPKADKLYIGFDCWMSDEQYEKPFNDESSKPDLEAAGPWKKFSELNSRMYGVLFELTSTDGKTFKADCVETGRKVKNNKTIGGFYPGVYENIGQHVKLVDLRLD